MFCSKCGKENDESAKFCSSCGNSLGSDVEKSAEQKAEEIKQKPKESATTIFYLIKPLLKLKVLVPMVVIFLGVMFYPSMKSAYENYQYEKEKIAKEKRETFTDSATGLMWQIGYEWNRDRWEDAIDYCEQTNFAGFNDWRLPSTDEYNNITFYKENKNLLSASHYSWTIDCPSNIGFAYTCNFADRGCEKYGYIEKKHSLWIRCVRNAK